MQSRLYQVFWVRDATGVAAAAATDAVSDADTVAATVVAVAAVAANTGAAAIGLASFAPGSPPPRPRPPSWPSLVAVVGPPLTVYRWARPLLFVPRPKAHCPHGCGQNATRSCKKLYLPNPLHGNTVRGGHPTGARGTAAS